MTIKKENDYSGIISELILLNDAKNIVEIGVNAGETTIALCESATQTNGKVYGFDMWERCGLFNQFSVNSSKEFVDNKLKKFGFNNYTLTKINTYDPSFRNVIKETVNGKIDVAFIDGCHSYKGCLNDLQAVWPLLSDTGVVVFHDTQRIDGCREIIYDLRTKFYDGTYDVFDLYGGYKHRNMGISFLIKRQFPTLKIPINQLCGSPNTAKKIEQLEKEWYENEKKTSTNRIDYIDLMSVDINELELAKIDSFRPKRDYLN